MSVSIERLVKELGERVLLDPEILAAHRHDSWMLAELLDLQGRPGPSPLAVVEVRSTEDVSVALRICRELGVSVIPFGGGSGVCGAIRAQEGVVVLSTRRLEGLVELDETDLTATFLAGTMGGAAERTVQKSGLTIGHWPQSIELSTVGGWVATRAAGQYSTGYGSIEDVLLALQVVLPDGSIMETRPTPRAATGPDLRQLFLGSEGTLGVITRVTLSLRPLPESSVGQTFHFADLDAGLRAIRLAMRAGWRPPVVRLYDVAESERLFSDYCPEGRSLLLLLHEGPATLVAAQRDALTVTCQAEGGVEADDAALDHWLEHRNQVPGFRDLLDRGLVVDTIEVACTWSRVGRLYDEVTRSLRELPDLLVASAHSSHSYRSGTNLYFTFAARPAEREQMAALYSECWRRVMRASVSVGAGIAHHHGIGRVRRDWLPEEIGPEGVRVLRGIKASLDPAGLLNPGVLLPDVG